MMTSNSRALAAVATLTLAALTTAPLAGAAPPSASVSVEQLTSGIAGANGSTTGPDGALYVTESDTGSILRVDRSTGTTTVFASGLPTRIAPIGGPMDVVFHGGTAYALVSLVGGFFGTDDASGIYRHDGGDDWTLIADLGQWALDNPPSDDIDFFIPTGVHYSIESYRGGFVVTDAHHNKVLRVSRDGVVGELGAFGNIVPTGLETWGDRVLVAFAGPQPHLPEDGRVLTIAGSSGAVEELAAGGRLLVDVERGRGAAVFGLAQGVFPAGEPDGTPAQPDTGELLRLDPDGTMTPLATGLDRPTSMEIVGDTAFVVGLDGTVVRVDGVGGPPFGRR